MINDAWGVVQVIVVLVGLFLTVGKPIINLNSTMTKLTTKLESMETQLKSNEEHNTESHRRIWQKNTEQDKTLQDHERRIVILEKEVDN